MFADDLILITKASRKTARNCLLCLDLYHNLTGQKPNPRKSRFYLPSQANQTIAKSISRILGFFQGNFPFIYIGCSISPKRLPAAQFNSITNKVHKVIHSWNHSSISTASRAILLNSMIFFIPNYLLLIMHLPAFILNDISKLAHNFLWGLMAIVVAFIQLDGQLLYFTKLRGTGDS